MCKTIGKVVLLGLLVTGGVVAVKSSSYVATLWNNTRQAVARQVPRELEMDRVRLQISKLDGDVRGLLGPVAEKMALVKKLDREVKAARESLTSQRDYLVALTREVEAGGTVVSLKGEEFTMGQAKTKLGRDFASLKRGEAALASQEKLLDAHQKNLQSTKEQLNIILDQKRDFEVRLAQLEANEAGIAFAKQLTPLPVDDSRIADIKRTLAAIEIGQEKDLNLLELQKHWEPRIQGNQTPTSARPAVVDLNEIKTYLGIGNAAADGQ